MRYAPFVCVRRAEWPAIVAVVLCVACGTNDPEIPPGLLDAISRSGTGAGEYPSGPYGAAVGDVVRNLCFDGWRNPSEAAFDPARFERLCFADFYDPEGAKGIRVLLVNTAAVWCLACKQEWCGTGSRRSLSEETSERFDRGFRTMGLLFEDASSNRAKPLHVAAWTEACEVTVPFGLDADFAMDTYADATVQPFNMVIRTSDMTIAAQKSGDQPADLFAEIDALLDAATR